MQDCRNSHLQAYSTAQHATLHSTKHCAVITSNPRTENIGTAFRCLKRIQEASGSNVGGNTNVAVEKCRGLRRDQDRVLPDPWQCIIRPCHVL